MHKNNSLLFLGDVVPYKRFKFHNEIRAVINLECPIYKAGLPQSGKINLSVSENYLGHIFGQNLFMVSLGNNHILDYGNEGLESTISELEKLNSSYFGINGSLTGSFNPLVTDFQGISIAFFSVVCQSTSPVFTIDGDYQISTLNVETLIDQVKAIRSSVQRVVVYIHWGTEESSYPEIREINDARRLIENGVDIVIGSHAHAPQPIERYKEGIIAYNLGNFIMPDLVNIPTYFDDKGSPQSTYNKRTMIWNRISWGIIIDMSTLEYRIHKYIFIKNRIFRVPFTILDRYLRLKKVESEEVYTDQIKRHLTARAQWRRLKNFILQPHVPKILKKVK